MLLTASQISERIKRPPTTVRDWGQKYRDYLPRKQKGRFFEYSELAIDIFKRISELHQSGLTTNQVKETLNREQGKQQDGDIISDNEATTTENSLVVSQQFQATYQGLIKLFEEQRETNKLLKEQNELLREKLGLNEPTRSPTMNDKPKADKKRTPRTKPTTKAVNNKHRTPPKKTVKRKVNKRGRNGRFVKKKQNWFTRLLSD